MSILLGRIRSMEWTWGIVTNLCNLTKLGIGIYLELKQMCDMVHCEMRNDVKWFVSERNIRIEFGPHRSRVEWLIDSLSS
jgi:hypothetical protein